MRFFLELAFKFCFALFSDSAKRAALHCLILGEALEPTIVPTIVQLSN